MLSVMSADRVPRPLDEVRVVLMRPRWARNLGAVARAMKNFELSRLTLVDSRIGSWSDAHVMAVHADDVLQAARTADSFEQAVEGARWVVGTGNQAPAGTRVLTPREVAERAREHGPPTLLFGGEIHGLEQAELLRCHAVSTIPTGTAQSSLNLATAVAIYAAELFQTLGEATAPPSASSPPPADDLLASPEMMQHVERRLRILLEGSRWANRQHPKDTLAQLMQPFYRAGMTELEARRWLVALGKAVHPRDR